MTARTPWFALPFLAGCFGVYAEVATTTLPSATIDGSTSAGATAVGLNIGAEFGSSRMRFALGYASDSLSFDGGSVAMKASSNRFDFNVFSISERLRLRLGLGFAGGSGTSDVGGSTQSSQSGTAFAGLNVTYFLSWKLGLHLFGGPIALTAGIPGGNVSGTGATFRLAVSYTFGDVRPDTKLFIPLDENRDLTGLLEGGANAGGCTATRDAHASSGYSALWVTCRGRKVLYIQIAEGLSATCFDMFKPECEQFTSQLIDSTKANLAKPATPAPAPVPATPAPAPAPAPEPATSPELPPAMEPVAPVAPAPPVTP